MKMSKDTEKDIEILDETINRRASDRSSIFTQNIESFRCALGVGVRDRQPSVHWSPASSRSDDSVVNAPEANREKNQVRACNEEVLFSSDFEDDEFDESLMYIENSLMPVPIIQEPPDETTDQEDLIRFQTPPPLLPMLCQPASEDWSFEQHDAVSGSDEIDVVFERLSRMNLTVVPKQEPWDKDDEDDDGYLHPENESEDQNQPGIGTETSFGSNAVCSNQASPQSAFVHSRPINGLFAEETGLLAKTSSDGADSRASGSDAFGANFNITFSVDQMISTGAIPRTSPEVAMSDSDTSKDTKSSFSHSRRVKVSKDKMTTTAIPVLIDLESEGPTVDEKHIHVREKLVSAEQVDDLSRGGSRCSWVDDAGNRGGVRRDSCSSGREHERRKSTSRSRGSRANGRKREFDGIDLRSTQSNSKRSKTARFVAPKQHEKEKIFDFFVRLRSQLKQHYPEENFILLDGKLAAYFARGLHDDSIRKYVIEQLKIQTLDAYRTLRLALQRHGDALENRLFMDREEEILGELPRQPPPCRERYATLPQNHRDIHFDLVCCFHVYSLGDRPPRDVVHIAAMMFDVSRMQPTAFFSELCLPTNRVRVDDFMRSRRITQYDLERAKPFKVVFKNFMGWLKKCKDKKPSSSLAIATMDKQAIGQLLQEQTYIAGLRIPMVLRFFFNIRKHFIFRVGGRSPNSPRDMARHFRSDISSIRRTPLYEPSVMAHLVHLMLRADWELIANQGLLRKAHVVDFPEYHLISVTKKEFVNGCYQTTPA